MGDFFKIIVVVLTLSLLIVPAFAFMPSSRGVSAPQTVWSDRGIQGTVSGKVVTSLDRTQGVEGAYVALVNAMSPGKEYYNTTTDADGNYRFTGVNATYSYALLKGPDGTVDSYKQGMSVYMVYANYSAGEGYSSAFGVDTNRTNNVIDPIVVFTGVPSNEATPEPEITVEPTAAVETPVPPTATPSATPAPAGQLSGGLLQAAAALVIFAIVATAANFMYTGKKKKK